MRRGPARGLARSLSDQKVSPMSHLVDQRVERAIVFHRLDGRASNCGFQLGVAFADTHADATAQHFGLLKSRTSSVNPLRLRSGQQVGALSASTASASPLRTAAMVSSGVANSTSVAVGFEAICARLDGAGLCRQITPPLDVDIGRHRQVQRTDQAACNSE